MAFLSQILTFNPYNMNAGGRYYHRRQIASYAAAAIHQTGMMEEQLFIFFGWGPP